MAAKTLLHLSRSLRVLLLIGAVASVLGADVPGAKDFKAYLYDFGTTSTAATLDIGSTVHPFTPVPKDQVYGQGGDFGFMKEQMSDDVAGWLKEPITRTSVRLNKNASFLFSPEPGKYQLRIAISALGEGSHLAVNGGTEVFEKNLTRDQGVVETDIETTGEPITINVDDYAAIGWITLIEKSAPSYAKPTGE